ncbi:class II fumarate hydratase [Acidocella sp. KAb 2-4]|uniref:class II fumarate hydratase n=1 Tax=Acidocella sp. KAb 2-4 TaxID=2885158 RepID=UPI001D0630EA|nr:class II fumarate hydratase [Acidocella sp. KAb 2-4]MCB5943212.1 class II fumarate hydratase [Acidocella sp. KAb 2-4]
MAEPRIEHDALGEVAVPAARLWGAQTQRSLENFVIGRRNYVWGRAVIRAFGLLKQAAAEANLALGQLPEAKARLIIAAAREVAGGQWDDEFPLVVFQTGSGTQTNMNANEVIANRAIQMAGGALGSKTPVHPNDDVNHSQSSNDAFPTVMHIAAVEALHDKLFPAVRRLAGVFAALAVDYAGVVMTGRTHLQDATPVTLGQVISGWQAQLMAALEGLEATLPGLYELAIGGTAVGTGLNAHPDFGATVAAGLARETGHPFRPAPNKFAALSAHDALVAASGAVRVLAGAAMKIANDVRWYASGPRTGIGELLIPENEPGSSIMPGKINPTQAEALTQVAVQVFGLDHAIAFAGSQGNFQLNVYKPLILHDFLDEVTLLAEALESFTSHCAEGISPARPRIAENLARNLMLVTALNPHIGYSRAAEIALKAHHEGLTLREAALSLGVAPQDFDAWVNPEAMTRPLPR